MSTWLKVLLGLSLFFNVLIVGFIAGQTVGGDHRGPRERGAPPPMAAPMSLGPRETGMILRVFEPAERREILQKQGVGFRDFRAMSRRIAGQGEELRKALEAEPYDAQAMEEALAALRASEQEMLAVSDGLWREALSRLDDDQRAELRQRLEKRRSFQRGPGQGMGPWGRRQGEGADQSREPRAPSDNGEISPDS